MMLSAARNVGISSASLAGLLVSACGASAGSPSAMFKEQVVSHTPTERAIAASSTFFSCRGDGEKDRYVCYACEVTLHDRDEGGLVAYASDYEHTLKPWEEGGPPKISITGERAFKKFEQAEASAPAAHEIFDAANDWCKGRRKGSFHLLKDEIDTYFAGEGE